MFKLRFLTPLLFASALLFAQQGGAAHALHHVLAAQAEQQQSKQTPHTNDCEQCTTYAQLASALNCGPLSFDFCASQTQTYTQDHQAFFIQRSLPAIARGPPFPQASA